MGLKTNDDMFKLVKKNQKISYMQMIFDHRYKMTDLIQLINYPVIVCTPTTGLFHLLIDLVLVGIDE